MEQTHTVTPEEKLALLVRKEFPAETGNFRPCAFFDEPLDCIRVIARDCSFTEIRVSDLLTVLADNYYPESGGRGKGKYMGFTIKGAKHICEQNQIKFTVAVRLTELLDAILSTSPELAVRIAVDCIARPLVEDQEIDQVNVSGHALAPQAAS